MCKWKLGQNGKFWVRRVGVNAVPFNLFLICTELCTGHKTCCAMNRDCFFSFPRADYYSEFHSVMSFRSFSSTKLSLFGLKTMVGDT